MKKRNAWLLLLVATSGLLALSYHGVLEKWIQDLWQDPNYSHGLIVPFIALFIAWQKRNSIHWRPSPSPIPGVLLVALGSLLYVIGVIAGELFTQRMAFLLTFWGLWVAFFGRRITRPLLFPLLYLVFMVPLPYILYDAIGFPLKLLASSSATWFLQLIGVPIYREGNLLYLPNMVLEVVDACSGIRSLMSILALSVVVAYFMHKDLLRRVLTVLISIPVVLFTNALRIVITGILAWEKSPLASGFFHAFEGELLFIVGVVILVAFSALLKKKGGTPHTLASSKTQWSGQGLDVTAKGLVSLTLIPIMVIASYGISRSALQVQPTGLLKPLSTFPKKIGGYVQVAEDEMPPKIIEVLKVDSYLLRAYRSPSGYVLWLYIGYFKDQKEGAMIHSPKHCYPGSGWHPIATRIKDLKVKAHDDGTRSIHINEYLLQKGEARQLVYYWYHSRGRVIANEYVDRFYMILDSITRKRSDGSLVRVSGPVGKDLKGREELLHFTQALFPVLGEYLPE